MTSKMTSVGTRQNEQAGGPGEALEALMVYKPMSGWVQVTKRAGVLLSQRFHQDLDCGNKATQSARAKGQECELIGPYTYGEVRGFKQFDICKCGGGRRDHAQGPDRRWGEVSAGSQGTGRRR